MPTVLLCHCDGTNGSTGFTDVSASAHTLTTLGSVTVSTASPKFGTGCAHFPGSVTEGITANYTADFNFGAGQFTVEAWVNVPSAPSLAFVVTQWGSSGIGWALCWVSGALAFYYSTTGSDNPNVGAAYTPALNTWIHIAADRDTSNVLRVYANGVVIASATVSATIFASTLNAAIGSDSNGSNYISGNIDEVRVTKGQAMYGGPFTPPTGPFGGVTAQAQAIAMVLA